MNMDVPWSNHSFNDNVRKWLLGVRTAQTANTRTPTTRAIAQPKARTPIIQASRLLGIVGETGAHALARQIERGTDLAHAAHTQAKANDGLAGGRGTCIKLRHLKTLHHVQSDCARGAVPTARLAPSSLREFAYSASPAKHWQEKWPSGQNAVPSVPRMFSVARASRSIAAAGAGLAMLLGMPLLSSGPGTGVDPIFHVYRGRYPACLNASTTQRRPQSSHIHLPERCLTHPCRERHQQ